MVTILTKRLVVANEHGRSVMDPFSTPEGRALWAKVCDFYGIDTKTVLYPLGEGSQGEAFEFPGNKVLKLTWDRSEALASAIIAAKPDPKKNVVQVDKDSVVQIILPKGWDIPLYAYTMERLSGLFEPYDLMANYIGSANLTLRSVNRQLLQNSADKLWKQKLEGNYPPEKLQIFKKWIDEVCDYLTDVGISFKDLHEGNVMMRGDNLVLIDLGYSVSRGSPRLNVISRMIAYAHMIEKFRVIE